MVKKKSNPLNKRFLRELKSEAGKYIVLFVFIAGVIALVSGFLVASGSMSQAYDESFEKYNIEDGNFEVKREASSGLLDALQKDGTKTQAEILGHYGMEPYGKPKRRGPAPLLRKEFSCDGDILRARLYVCGLGYAFCTINGKKISDTLEGEADVTVEVGALSQLLMGTLTARDLVFEGKLSVSEEWLDYFDILYPEQKTYINEWW
mgnify:CR=1 FL=1